MAVGAQVPGWGSEASTPQAAVAETGWTQARAERMGCASSCQPGPARGARKGLGSAGQGQRGSMCITKPAWRLAPALAWLPLRPSESPANCVTSHGPVASEQGLPYG